MNSNFTAGFGDELVKLSFSVGTFLGAGSDEGTYNAGNVMVKKWYRGAMRNAGLNPDKDSHNLIAAGAVATPVALGISGGIGAVRNESKIKKLQREVAEMRKAKPGMGAVIKKMLRRGK